MSDSFIPEPKKVGVWAEGTHIEAKEYIIPKKSPEAEDDIPTIPDLDDNDDIHETYEKDVSKPPVSEQKDTETVNALAEVGVGVGSTVDGIEGVLQVLNSYIPEVEEEEPDIVWTVDSLLMQLADEDELLNK